MANSASSSDLLKGALEDAGELSNGNSKYHEYALEKLNESYLAVLAGSNEFNVDCGEPWSWARNTTPKTLVLQPQYTTGTVGLTNGSAAGTFSSAPSSSLGSFKNHYIKISDRSSYYQIIAHTAGATSFTLDRAYIEATGATLAFETFPISYNLGSKILRLVEPFRVYGEWSTNLIDDADDSRGKIFGVELNRFRLDWPITRVKAGVPNRFATSRRSDQEWWVEVNGFPASATKVDIDYIEIPVGLTQSDTEYPIIPREFRKVLRYMTAHFVAIKKENADMAKYFFDLSSQTLKAMVKAELKNTTHTGKNKGRLIARQEQLNTRRTGYY